MPKYDEVFQRVEKKYRISDKQRECIEQALIEAGMQVDLYGRTRVTSLYLDTPAHEVIGRSIEKPLYKEKLRLRAYGDKASDALMRAFVSGASLDKQDRQISVFFELKKKLKGIVYKRRVALSIGAAMDWIKGTPFEQACLQNPADDPEMLKKSLAKRGLQIAHEIESAWQRWGNLEVKTAITCEREAWTSSISSSSPCADSYADSCVGSCAGSCTGPYAHSYTDPYAGSSAHPYTDPYAGTGIPEDFRVTFDSNLSWLEIDSRLSWLTLLKNGESIMEIKSAQPYPMWMVDVLDQTSTYPGSFSKYGAAYIEMQKLANTGKYQKARHLKREKLQEQPVNLASSADVLMIGGLNA